MLQPLKQNNSQRSVKQTRAIKAPVRGWSDKAATDVIGSDYAAVLENLIPNEDGVAVRPGQDSHATGIGAAVVRVFPYHAGSTKKLFASTAAAVFEVTSAGAVGAADLSSLTNGKWSTTMFSTSGGNFLCMVNGADGFRTYDGSSWTTETITGATAADLVYISQFKERIWCIEDGTLSAWYMDTVLAKSGGMTEFPLGSVFERGGELQSIFTWSRDGGAGLDDVQVFLTDQGEAAIYSGINPAGGGDYALIGVFRLDKPLGRDCWVKTGGDVLILTQSGPISLTAAFTTSDIKKAAPKDVSDSFRRAALVGAALDGWQMVHHTDQGWYFANVPITASTQYDQYLVNAVGGSWCKLKGFVSTWWASLDGEMYYGDPDGNVRKALNSGQKSDDDATITFKMVPGWDRYGTGNIKDARSLRLYMRTDAEDPTPLIEMRADFNNNDSSRSAGSFEAEGGSPWDTSPWDTSAWGPSTSAKQRWYGVSATGAVLAAYVQGEVKDTTFEILGYDATFEVGDGF